MSDVVLAVALSEQAGPLGLLVILVLGTATVLLVRSMDRRVKRLPREFPPEGEQPPPRTPPST